MTLEKCASLCSSYPYFGTQWSRECFCGDELTEGSAAAPEADCNMPCAGDSSQLCGGGRRLSLYNNADWTGPEVPSDIGSYEFYGCVTDSQGTRTLPSALLRDSAMTLNMCASFCGTGNYQFFGTEYGTECWCANALVAGATMRPITECSMVCPGNVNERCGNGDRLSVYTIPVAAPPAPIVAPVVPVA